MKPAVLTFASRKMATICIIWICLIFARFTPVLVTGSLTKKGQDLASVLTKVVLWAAAHEETGNQALVRLMKKDKTKFLADIRKHWTTDR